MDTKQVKQEKEMLQKHIADLLLEFEETTGTKITSIDVFFTSPPGSPTRYFQGLTFKIEI